jgi:hypothetical protein
LCCQRATRGKLIGHGIDEHPHQSGQVVKILAPPIAEHGQCHLLARGIQGIRRRFPVRRDDRFVYPLIGLARPTVDEAQFLQTRNLPADGGVVAADTSGEINHADRSQPLDKDEQREQRAFERQTRLVEEFHVALRPIHHARNVD